MKKRKIIIVFVISMLLITVINWYSSTRFSGSDDKGEEAVIEIASDYKPWVEGIGGVPSPKVENIMFGIQGAIGITFIIYYLGKKKNDKDNRRVLKDK